MHLPYVVIPAPKILAAILAITAIVFSSTATAALRTATAADAVAAPTPVLLSNELVVTGEIVSRGEQGFVVLSSSSQLVTVLVSPDTSILKGAETIRLSELMPGDKITAKVTRAPDGSFEAVTVNVRTGYE